MTIKKKSNIPLRSCALLRGLAPDNRSRGDHGVLALLVAAARVDYVTDLVIWKWPWNRTGVLSVMQIRVVQKGKIKYKIHKCKRNRVK
jgi:hypothetical protein